VRGDSTDIDGVGPSIGRMVEETISSYDRRVSAAALMHEFGLSCGDRTARGSPVSTSLSTIDD
jgi:hypothetical protein